MLKTAPAILIIATLCVQQAAALEIGAGQAMQVQTERGVAQVVVGDPRIADVSVDPSGRITLFGKQSGATSLLVFDRAGRVLLDENVAVRSGGPGTVIVTYAAGKNVKPGGMVVIHACGVGCSPTAELKDSGGASQKP